MADIVYTISLRDKISKATQSISNSFDKLKNSVAKTSTKIDTSFNNLQKKASQTADKIKSSFSLKNIGAFAAGLGAVEVGKNIIQKTADFEKYNAVLTNVFQSSQKAAEAQKMLAKFAAETPFELMQITESYTKLANRGFVATEKQLTSLGDLAAASGKSFDQLAEAFLDAQTTD